MATAKCYSHQVNPEMQNDYCVFIVNYVYCLYTGTVLIFMKITTEFANPGCEFCLVSRGNMLLKSVMQLGLRWVFRRARFFGVCTQVSQCWVCCAVYN